MYTINLSRGEGIMTLVGLKAQPTLLNLMIDYFVAHAPRNDWA